MTEPTEPACLSPCTASSQAISVNGFRSRIRDERLLDHVTQNASAARNNEAKGLGKEPASPGGVSTPFKLKNWN